MTVRRRTPPEVWPAVDWTRADSVIADQLGVSRQCVNRHRRRLNQPSPRRSRTDERAATVAALATRMTVSEIATALGMPNSTVSDHLRRTGVTAITSPIRRKAWRYDWDAVDWAGKTNNEIAQELNCASAAVATTRRRQGRPAAPRAATPGGSEDGRVREPNAAREAT